MIVIRDGGDLELATAISQRLYASGWLVLPVKPTALSQAYEFHWTKSPGLEILYVIEKRFEDLAGLVASVEKLSFYLIIAISGEKDQAQAIRFARNHSLEFLNPRQSLEDSALTTFSRLFSGNWETDAVKLRLLSMTPLERRTLLLLLGETSLEIIQATLKQPLVETKLLIQDVCRYFGVSSPRELIAELA